MTKLLKMVQKSYNVEIVSMNGITYCTEFIRVMFLCHFIRHEMTLWFFVSNLMPIVFDVIVYMITTYTRKTMIKIIIDMSVSYIKMQLWTVFVWIVENYGMIVEKMVAFEEWWSQPSDVSFESLIMMIKDVYETQSKTVVYNVEKFITEVDVAYPKKVVVAILKRFSRTSMILMSYIILERFSILVVFVSLLIELSIMINSVFVKKQEFMSESIVTGNIKVAFDRAAGYAVMAFKAAYILDRVSKKIVARS